MRRAGHRAWNRWPEEQVARLRALHQAGATPVDIAADLGRTEAAVRCKQFKLGIVPNRGAPKPKPPKPPTIPAPDCLPVVLDALALEPDIKPVAPKNRGAAIAAAKAFPLHLTFYVAHVELGYSRIATALRSGSDAKLVDYAVRRLEERRDDPKFDAFLDRLGDMARQRLAA